MSEEFYEVLEQLFGDTECYSDMPLRPGQDPGLHVTEAQLRQCAKKALDDLEKFEKK